MINVYFRIVNPETTEMTYFGFVSAKNENDLFWKIDEFCDPYQVELLKPQSGCGFVLKTRFLSEDIGWYVPKKKGLEITEDIMEAMNQSGWYKPEIVISTNPDYYDPTMKVKK